MVAVQSQVQPIFTPYIVETGSFVPLPFTPSPQVELGSYVPFPTYTVIGSHVPQPVTMSAEEVQERVQQQVDAQKSVACEAAEQAQKTVCEQIAAKRDAKLLALEQSFVEEKMKLDQDRVQKIAGIEQEALAWQAQMVQARTVSPGMPVPLTPEKIAEQKAQKLEVAQAQCDVALARLTVDHEARKGEVELKAERKLALATSQIEAERADRVAALDEQLEQERVARLPLAEQQAALASKVSQDAERALERVTQHLEMEKNVACQAAEQAQKTVCEQIAAKRDAKLLALEQSFVEEKQKLEQGLAHQVAGIEQLAQAPESDPEKIAEQKAQKLEVAQAQCEAALAQITVQHEGQKEQVSLKAERKLALATSQIEAERADRVAALDEQLEKERLAVGQQRLQREVSLPGPKQAEELRSLSEAALAQQVAAEKNLARSAAQRSESRLATQILQQREVELNRIEQSYLQQKTALEQSHAQAVASVNQTAFMQVEQSRAVQCMPYAQLPPMMDTEFMARRVEADFSAALSRLGGEFEAQKAAVQQIAEKQEEALRAQMKAEEQAREALEQAKMQRSVSAPFLGFAPYPMAYPLMFPAMPAAVQTRPRGVSHFTDVSGR